MKQTAFLSEGRISLLQDGNVKDLTCTTAEKYREREREIRMRNEWKHSGAGAMFTGTYRYDEGGLDIKLPIMGISCGLDGRLLYTLNFDDGGGIYFKHPDPTEPETPVLADLKTAFFELDINPSGNIAVSCAENYLERHIGFLNADKPHLQSLTEGECSDCNPKWSRRDENVLFYDSAGIGYSANGHFAGFGPRSICRLNTKTGELDEILTDDKFDYTAPFEDEDGNLYFIRRPYKQPKGGKMTFMDYIKAPGKIARTFGGWLDFKSRTYTGESLKSSGANPAKGNTKSPQQIFIDGNLLEADKAMKKNAAAGDKNPGIIPRDWELMVRRANGSEEVLQKSVMSYCVTNGGIAYSNGKFIVINETATKASLASKLVGM
ncbi:MAG: hypothetical protein FWB98_05795 [Defluviitaleaceae bacterium]|nr:hypothetical protein [Defluviitaleaceae bacterium]